VARWLLVPEAILASGMSVVPQQQGICEVV